MADRKHWQRKGIDWDVEVARARERGESLAQLAVRVGVAKPTAHKAARRRGYSGHAPPQRKGIDWDAELARAVECRETPKALATRLGVSKITVWRARKARGVMLPAGREEKNPARNESERGQGSRRGAPGWW